MIPPAYASKGFIPVSHPNSDAPGWQEQLEKNIIDHEFKHKQGAKQFGGKITLGRTVTSGSMKVDISPISNPEANIAKFETVFERFIRKRFLLWRNEPCYDPRAERPNRQSPIANRQSPKGFCKIGTEQHFKKIFSKKKKK